MEKLGIEAKYIGGASGSIFVQGKRYALWFTITRNTAAPVRISTQDGSLASSYGSLRAFLDNWEVIQ